MRKRRAAALKGWKTRRKNAAKRVKKRVRKSQKVAISLTRYVGRAPPGQFHFAEERFYGTGNDFLGYLEGRPGVVGVLKATNFRPVGQASNRPKSVPRAVQQRIRAIDIEYQDAADAWAECEDGGAMVECEVSYEEGD